MATKEQRQAAQERRIAALLQLCRTISTRIENAFDEVRRAERERCARVAETMNKADVARAIRNEL